MKRIAFLLSFALLISSVSCMAEVQAEELTSIVRSENSISEELDFSKVDVDSESDITLNKENNISGIVDGIVTEADEKDESENLKNDILSETKEDDMVEEEVIEDIEFEEANEISQEAATGSAGKKATWTYGNSILTISGSGEWEVLEDLSKEVLNNTKKIIVKEGITAISDYLDIPDLPLLEEIEISGTVKVIGENAFSFTSLKKVTLKEGIKAIKNYAFSDTPIDTITIPASVLTIGIDSIPVLKNVNVASNNSYYSSLNGVLFDKDKKTLIYYPSEKDDTIYTVPKTVTRILDISSSSLKKIILPEGVKIIGYFSCPNLSSINVPSTVTQMGDIYTDAGRREGDYEILGDILISYVGNGGDVVIPNSVKYINSLYGSENKYISSLKIPKSVVRIFGGLSVKNKIIVDSKNTNFASKDGILYNKDYTTLIKCPDNITGSITIPSTVTTIKEEAFCDCSDLTLTFTSKAPSIDPMSFISTNIVIRYHKNKGGWDNINFDNEYGNNVILKNLDNTISCKVSSKIVSGKKRTINLGISSKESTKLTYSSSNSKLPVNSKGIVTIPAGYIGKTTITVTAAKTKSYAKTTRKFTFKVLPGKVTIDSVSGKSSEKILVKWKKNAYITGYELRYSKAEDWIYDDLVPQYPAGSTAHVKEKAVTLSNSITSATITGLMSKTTYTIKIRAYKTVGSTKYYGAWSSIIKATTK